MRLLIDRKDLELLLEKDREYIGNNVGIDTTITKFCLKKLKGLI